MRSVGSYKKDIYIIGGRSDRNANHETDIIKIEMMTNKGWWYLHFFLETKLLETIGLYMCQDLLILLSSEWINYF